MSQIISVVLRVFPTAIDALCTELQRYPNVEIALTNTEKGVVIALVTDEGETGTIAETLTRLQLLPQVQACSVAYEFFEPDQSLAGENHG
jgi:nitrate reductase NapAB chaperone NapD